MILLQHNYPCAYMDDISILLITTNIYAHGQDITADDRQTDIPLAILVYYITPKYFTQS